MTYFRSKTKCNFFRKREIQKFYSISECFSFVYNQTLALYLTKKRKLLKNLMINQNFKFL